jgi:long-chain fatty acid transport protein
MHRMVTICSRFVLVSTASLVFSAVAQASYFQLNEYNAAGVGNAQAGGAAIAEDASTTFSNPAGLVRLPQELVVSDNYLLTRGVFKGVGCGGITSPVDVCIPSRINENNGVHKFVPAIHYALPLSKDVVVGFGMTGPFGLVTRYDNPNDPIRYTATKSSIRTVNLNPSVGFRLNDKWSVGLGADAMQIRAILDATLNLDPNHLITQVQGPNGPIPVPAHTDTRVYNHAKDWGYGWNAGILYAPIPSTRLGLSYRSQIAMHLKGTSQFSGGSWGSGNPESRMRLDTTLPETWMLSAFHNLTPKWDIMGTLAYTGWDSIEQLRLKNALKPNPITGLFGGITTGTITIPQALDNTWRMAVGADFNMNEHWRFRLGGAYDATPVGNEHRIVNLPDGDRSIAALGLRYSPNKCVDFDLSYQHLWFKDGKVNTIGPVNEAIGEADSKADLIGLQITWNLDETIAAHRRVNVETPVQGGRG